MADFNQSALNTLVNASGNAIAAGKNKRLTKMTIKAQKEAQEYEWQQNLALYHYNNQYNSPEAQMQRLKDAGLNPNLVYGSGSVSGNTSGALPRYEAPSPDYRGSNQSESASFLQAAAQYLDYQTKTAQIDNLQATNEMIQTQTAGVEIENLRKEFDLDLETELRGSTVTSRSNKALQSTSELGLSEELRQMKAIEAHIARETLDDAISLVRQNLTNARARGQVLDQDFFLRQQQVIAQRLENELRELGITSQDTLLTRIAGRILNQIFPNLLNF